MRSFSAGSTHEGITSMIGATSIKAVRALIAAMALIAGTLFVSPASATADYDGDVLALLLSSEPKTVVLDVKTGQVISVRSGTAVTPLISNTNFCNAGTSVTTQGRFPTRIRDSSAHRERLMAAGRSGAADTQAHTQRTSAGTTAHAGQHSARGQSLPSAAGCPPALLYESTKHLAKGLSVTASEKAGRHAQS